MRWALLILLCACDDCPDVPDDCVETDLAVTQGIYGQVLEGDDVEHGDRCAQHARPVSYPVWLEGADGVLVAEDTADARGAFELAAPGGEYTVCVRDSNGSARCGGRVTVPAAGRVRYDIATSVLATMAVARTAARCPRQP